MLFSKIVIDNNCENKMKKHSHVFVSSYQQAARQLFQKTIDNIVIAFFSQERGMRVDSNISYNIHWAQNFQKGTQ